MLRFFRKIRLQLIRDLNVRRYLAYAIGEVALVMIGILLALQVNNWNEERKISLERKAVYDALLNEFELAKELYGSKRLEYDKVQGAMIKILENTGFKVDIFRMEEFDSLLSIALETVIFNPSFFIFQDVIETDKIELVTDLSLKSLLYEYVAIDKDYRSFQQIILRDISEELIPYLNKHIAFKNLNHPINLNKSRILQDNRDVLLELEFENLLDNALYIHLKMIEYYENLGVVMDEIISVLKVS